MPTLVAAFVKRADQVVSPEFSMLRFRANRQRDTKDSPRQLSLEKTQTIDRSDPGVTRSSTDVVGLPSDRGDPASPRAEDTREIRTTHSSDHNPQR